MRKGLSRRGKKSEPALTSKAWIQEIMKILLGVLIGALVGFGIGYLGKCTSGACPLTSNPFISAAIGGLVGFLIVVGK